MKDNQQKLKIVMIEKIIDKVERMNRRCENQ